MGESCAGIRDGRGGGWRGGVGRLQGCGQEAGGKGVRAGGLGGERVGSVGEKPMFFERSGGGMKCL